MRSDFYSDTDRLLDDFRRIDAERYRDVLRFVEDHADYISRLPPRAYFHCYFAYVGALYESGCYEKVIEYSRELLELSILHNITDMEGVDVYRLLLFRKASAFYYLADYKTCLRLTDQILRLYPEDPAAGLLYERALYRSPPLWLRRARACSILLFLLAAVITAAEIFYVKPFAPDELILTKQFRNGAFVGGWLVLLGSDILHRLLSWRRVGQLRTDYRRARAARSLD